MAGMTLGGQQILQPQGSVPESTQEWARQPLMGGTYGQAYESTYARKRNAMGPPGAKKRPSPIQTAAQTASLPPTLGVEQASTPLMTVPPVTAATAPTQSVPTSAPAGQPNAPRSWAERPQATQPEIRPGWDPRAPAPSASVTTAQPVQISPPAASWVQPAQPAPAPVELNFPPRTRGPRTGAPANVGGLMTQIGFNGSNNEGLFPRTQWT